MEPVNRTIPALLLLTLLPLAGARAAELGVVREHTVFAVVTHKAGFASKRAHDHFIAARGYEARLAGEAGSLEGAAFEIELAAEDLVVDSPDLEKAWYPRLEALGILAEPFGELTEKDRAKIRASMLGKKQLDAAQFPAIKARLAGLTEKKSTLGSEELRYEVTMSLEVHGRKATRPLAANVAWEGDTLRVEAAGVFNFTDFGIEPFSAFMGAVKNTDELHVYVSLVATSE
jgi:hypothetical protein